MKYISAVMLMWFVYLIMFVIAFACIVLMLNAGLEYNEQMLLGLFE